MNTFGLLGKTLGHSFSPLIHNCYGDYVYRLFEVLPEDVGDFLREGDFCGLNVTIPYKETVVPYLDSLSETAERLGIVNTIVRRSDRTLHGDNTDYAGFLYLCDRAGVDFQGKKVLVLGSGGSAKTVKTACFDHGSVDIICVSRSGKVNYETVYEHTDADVIVNTTPIGMYPQNGERLLDLERFSACTHVLDIVFNPLKTALLLDAQRLGKVTRNGLDMLAAQAKFSSEQFQGCSLDDCLIAEAAAVVEKKVRNIAIVGMPGAGKSTLARFLAQKTGRKLLDTDEMIFEKYGQTAGEIIRTRGEDEFRALERQVVAEAGKQSGVIISPGGGVVLHPKNIDSLRQNGLVVYLRRPLNELATEGRPLSQGAGALEVLYDKRAPLYEQAADLIVDPPVFTGESDPLAALAGKLAAEYLV